MSRKIDKVEQILESSIEEFHSKGFDSSSMQNIADQAQVSKRTLYKYYPTKEDLYFSLIDEILDRIQGMFSFKYDPNSTVKAQLENIIDTKMELTLSDSFIKLSRIVIGELFKDRSPKLEQLQKFTDTETLFVHWVASAKKDKKIKSTISVEEISEQFHAIMKEQIYWPVLMNLKKKEELNLTKIKDNTVEFFIKAFC